MDNFGSERIRLNLDTIFIPTPNSPEKDEVYDKEDEDPSTNIRRTLIDSHIFRIGKDNEADEAFMNERVKGWIHGVKAPYTVLKYRKVESESTNNIFLKSNQQEIFIPQVVFEQIDHESLKLKEKPPGDASTHNKVVGDRELLAKKETSSGFSGYLFIPKTSVNIPNWCRLDEERGKQISELPQLCYQNHVDLGEITYTFGGILVNKYGNFQHLGIPIDVDPEKISIEFPCELPPHINKDILISPYMMQNPHLVLFNLFRNTLSYCDTFSSSIFPGHLNSMSSCQISKKHVFFCGGFETKVDSVEYLTDIDRWVIKKRLVMNDCGYILDVRTLKFSKILLHTKDDSLSLARIGDAITSNLYEPTGVNHEVPDRCLLPPIFADTSSTDNVTFRSSPSVQPLTSPLPNHPNIRKIPESSNASSASSVTKVLDTPEQTKEPEPATPASTTSSYSFNPLRTSSSLKNLDQSEFSRTTPSLSSIKPTSSQNSSGQKFTNVLSKSTKLFHRHQKQPSNGTPKSPSHILKNTYSKQVRDNRSNSQNGSSESPTLPGGPPQKPSSTKASSGNNKDNSTEGDNNQSYNEPKKESDTMLEYQSKPLNSSASFAAPIITPFTNQCSANFDLQSTKSFENDCPLSEKNKETILDRDTEFVSVSIYIFGGFVCDTDEDGFQRFKASNDFYRIDLMSEDASYAIRFQEQALVQRIEGSNTSRNDDTESLDIFPTARGYFAFSLIDRSQTIDNNCCLGISSTNQPPKESVHLGVDDLYTGKYSKAPPTSDNASTNSTSVATSSSRCTSGITAEQKTPDDFFIGKALLIQGGCNENSDTFSDFYLFVFETGKWQTLSTYVHEYFNAAIQPFEDDDSSFFEKEKEIQDPKLIEAELRSCHHTALYYKNEERDYLFFVGGLYNDYLRIYDKEPHYSDKFDISRLSKFQLVAANRNVLRILVLNLQTQTWRFLKYFYDINHISDSKFFERLHENPSWHNARISNFGGCISMNGKRINVCHGLAATVPEKKEDLETLKKDIPDLSILFGGHISISFPSL